jgi:hypothetical protein
MVEGLSGERTERTILSENGMLCRPRASLDEMTPNGSRGELSDASIPDMMRLALVILLAVPVSLSSAQDVSGADAGTGRRQAFWLSFGLGGGRLADTNGALVDAHISATYSNGPLLVTVRNGGNATGLFSSNEESTKAWAGMLGVRTKSPQVFLTGAAGIGAGRRRNWSRPCDNCAETVTLSPTTKGLALNAGAHADLHAIGVALDVFSLSAPRDVRFVVWSFSLELGWFGH